MSPISVPGVGSNFLGKVVTLTLAVLWIMAALVYWGKSGDTSALYGLGLLAPPVAIFARIAWTCAAHDGVLKVLSGATFALIGLQALLLLVYSLREGAPLALFKAFQLVGLLTAVGLVVGSLWLATKMLVGGGELAGSQSSALHALIWSLQQHKAVAICFFVAVFCTVAVSLSFGLAFHDQGLRLAGHALEVDEDQAGLQEESRDEYQVGLYGVPHIPQRALEASATEVDASASHKLWKIRFPRGETQVETPARRGEVTAGSDEAVPSGGMAESNEVQLGDLVESLVSLSERGPVMVLMAGHADDTPPSGDQASFRSNLEFSQARVHQVWQEILLRLRGLEHGLSNPIDWYPMAFSDQGVFLDQEHDSQDGEYDRLLVEVAAFPDLNSARASHDGGPPGRPLELLDYLYFMVYTITTTGYGDIVPVSPYAKLTTSLANLCEVLFMVIFLNVLVAFLRTPEGEARGGDT